MTRSGSEPGSTIELPGDLAAAMLAHARAELPNEACGLVGGDRSLARASSFHPARNAYASPLRYDVDAEDLVRIVFAIESAGEELLAVFHSHTRSVAAPSATDVREARYHAIQLIASLANPEADADVLRAWRVADGTATEVAVRISA